MNIPYAFCKLAVLVNTDEPPIAKWTKALLLESILTSRSATHVYVHSCDAREHVKPNIHLLMLGNTSKQMDTLCFTVGISLHRTHNQPAL